MSTSYDSYIKEASEKYGVPEKLIKAVIQVESGGKNTATSSAGAQGLMQLMPQTAASLGVTDPLDPAQNIDGGTKYLAQQLKRFGGNVSMALAAYNAGPNAVIRYNGVPPYRETQAYVKKVKALYEGEDTIDFTAEQAEASNNAKAHVDEDWLSGLMQNITTILFVFIAIVLCAVFFFQAFPQTKSAIINTTTKAVGTVAKAVAK